MEPFRIDSFILAVSLVIGTPNLVFAHVGHGDEFQAQGGIQRVKVNAATDQMLGIVVTPIKPAAGGSSAVLVPATAVVDANGKQLVFVQYENFYEPVPITTGAAKGELVEVTQGLSAGEKLVTQGSLSLYAESRKTQTANASPSPAAITSPQTDKAHAQAHAQGTAHNHNTAQQASGLPMGILAAIGGGAVLLVGTIAFMGGNRKKKSPFSNKKGGF